MDKEQLLAPTDEKQLSVNDAEKIIKNKNFSEFDKIVGDKIKEKSDSLFKPLDKSLSTEAISKLTLDQTLSAIKLLTFLSPSLSLDNKTKADKILVSLNTKKDILQNAVSETDKTAALDLFEKGPESNFNASFDALFTKGKLNLSQTTDQTPEEKNLRKLVLAYCQIKAVSPEKIELKAETSPALAKRYIEVAPKGAKPGETFKIAWKSEQIKQATDQINKLSVKEGAKEQFDKIIEQFGGALLSVFELFGGKGALKAFCDKLKIPTTSLEKLYNDTYKLDADQTQSLSSVYTKDAQLFSSDKLPDPTKIQKYYKEIWLTEDSGKNFGYLDPVLVARAMKASPAIAVPGLIVADTPRYGESRYKIDPTVLATCSLEKKQAIVDQIFADPSFWPNVKSFSGKDVAISVYGKNDSSALSNWEAKAPKLDDAKDVAVVAGASLMKGSQNLKYTLAQSNLPYESNYKKPKQEGSSDTAEKQTIEKEWTSLFNKCSTTGLWKGYPLAADAEKKLSAGEKKLYSEYKKAIFDNITKLLNPNNKDVSVLSQDALKPFLATHFSVYLNSLKQAPLYKELNNKEAIDAVLSKFILIKSKLSIDASSSGISIKGKDAAKKDIEIDSNEFSWLPTIESKA